MAASPLPDFAADSREYDVEWVVTLVRLSRVTLLYGDASSGRSGFLRSTLMPKLESGADGEGAKVVVLFHAWDAAPVSALHALIGESVTSIASSARIRLPIQGSLTDSLLSWQDTLDISFLIVLDRFEEYLAAQPDLQGIRDFEEELVKMLNAARLRANFLLVLDEQSAPLLTRLRERIPGLDDASVRLPALSQAASGQAADECTEPALPKAPSATCPGSGFGVTDARATSLTAESSSPAIAESVHLREHAEETQAIAGPTPSLDAASGPKTSTHDRLRFPRLSRVAIGVMLIALSCFMLVAVWQPSQRLPATTQPAKPSPPIQAAEPGSGPVPEGLISPADDQTPHRSEQAALTAEWESKYEPTSAGAVEAPAAPMLYVHVRSDAQRARIQQLIEPLAKRGIRVSGIKRVRSGPSDSDLRYFHPEEADEAAKVLQALRDVGLRTRVLKRIAGFESQATPRQYELWLAGTEG